MSTAMPRKRLPVNPSEEHLKKQAKRLAKAESLRLADAQHRLAREYGFRNWAELLHVVEVMNRGADQLRDVKREYEPLPKAVRARDVATVRAILASGAFTRHDLDAGLAHAAWYGGDAPDVLAVRKELFDLLLDHGADPDGQYGSAYGPIIFGCGECHDLIGLQWLLDAGADVTAPPVETKYGPQCVLSTWLGAYVRGDATNAAKRRGIDTLLARGAVIPPDVTPPMLAIHRGDADELARLLDRDPDLVRRRFPDMPYGNVPLRGATLLHLAVEFGQTACVDLLLARGADINARATVHPDGFGGQTPIFHAVGTMHGAGVPVLEHLVDRAGRWIDRSVKARLVVCSDPMPHAMTPRELAEWAATESTPSYRRTTPRELALFRRLNRPYIGDDAAFAAAVDAIDAGDLSKLRSLLRDHPHLAVARAAESGSFAGPYFTRPALLWFVGENPIRTGRLAPNIVALAEAIIDAGANQDDVTYTLGLVVSGRVAREQGMQRPLIELLVRRGADAGAALAAAVGEGEREAAAMLLQLGAVPDFATAAGLGDAQAMRRYLAADQKPDDRMKGLALLNAARAGAADALAVLVSEAGVDVNSRIGVGGATALHHAAWFGRREAIDFLLAHGADRTITDTTHGGTPADWAVHAGHVALADVLRRRAGESPARGS